MGIGPIPASRKALSKAGLEVKDLDLIEANEAFAAQFVEVGRELNFDPDKVNVNGGAIALGHPIGASGARILVTLLYALKNRDKKLGLGNALHRRRYGYVCCCGNVIIINHLKKVEKEGMIHGF